MRVLIFFGLLAACALTVSTHAATIQAIEGNQIDIDKAAEASAALLQVDAGAHRDNEAIREARQLGIGGGYYPYGGYGSYGGYGRPFAGYGGYSGYGGYGRPLYGGYGVYGGHGVYPGFGFYG